MKNINDWIAVGFCSTLQHQLSGELNLKLVKEIRFAIDAGIYIEEQGILLIKLR